MLFVRGLKQHSLVEARAGLTAASVAAKGGRGEASVMANIIYNITISTVC